MSSPSPSPARLNIEDGRITHVPFTVDPHKLLQADGDPRRRFRPPQARP
ncbi:MULTISPECIES: hypothetical protein [unclassified Streptomyces]|nr:MULTISPECIES: hypothetical protein [unclassified Streptomyces]